ncbi:MAG: glycosyltransferase family 39 protein [Lachnospiraceae bacterium]|nr:glycosyltransferase family 39 protein [Lachnospiraceae bacterium]
MLIKKTWFSYSIWGVFAAFHAAILAAFWFFSGYLPEEQRILLSIALTILTVLAVCLVAFAAGRLTEYLRPRLHPDRQVLSILGDIAAGLIILSTFLARIFYLSRHVKEISDPDGLFDAAMIGSEGADEPTDLLSILTIRIVRLFLRIAGNRIVVASVATAVMQLLMIVCFYFAVRLLAGRVAALVSTGVAGFFPVCYERMLRVGTEPVFFTLFAMELLIIALYLYFDARGSYNKGWQAIWFVAVGAAMGYVAYVDLATVILWIPLLLSLLILHNDKVQEVVRLIIIFAASLIIFLLMLAQENGISDLPSTFSTVFETYFQGVNTVLLFHVPLSAYPMHILVVTFMAIVLVTFWRDRLRDRTTLWLLLFLASAFFVPRFGPTRLNAQELLCFCYATVIASGVTCLIAAPKKKGQPVDASAQPAAEDGMMMVMMPDGTLQPVPADMLQQMPIGMDIPQAAMPIGMDMPQAAMPVGMDMPQAAAPVGMNIPSGLPLQPVAAAAGLAMSPVAAAAGLAAQSATAPAQAAAAGTAAAGAAAIGAAALAGTAVQAASAAAGIAAKAAAVPEGMILPTGDGLDDGVSHMNAFDGGMSGEPIGLDRGEEGVNIMGENFGQTEQVLSKAEQKALAKAQKAQAKAEAKAAREAQKAAKKAERERLKRLDEDDEYEEAVAAGLISPEAPMPQTVPVPQEIPVPESAQAPQPAAPAVPPVPAPGQQAAAQPLKTLSEISPFAGKAPQTSQPSLVRNTAFNADGSDEFDFDVNGEDDFDV